MHIYNGILLLLSRFSHVQLCVTPETAAHQAPLSLGFSRQEHWSGLPFPNGILLSCKKGTNFKSVELRWMNLQPVVQSEVSQKEKNKYHILIHVCRI